MVLLAKCYYLSHIFSFHPQLMNLTRLCLGEQDA